MSAQRRRGEMEEKMKKKMLLALTGAMTISCLAETRQLIVKALSPYAGESWYDELEVVEEKREYAHSNFIHT